jgi:hypothetical protein
MIPDKGIKDLFINTTSIHIHLGLSNKINILAYVCCIKSNRKPLSGKKALM